jgi:hypothetical protein
MKGLIYWPPSMGADLSRSTSNSMDECMPECLLTIGPSPTCPYTSVIMLRVGDEPFRAVWRAAGQKLAEATSMPGPALVRMGEVMAKERCTTTLCRQRILLSSER